MRLQVYSSTANLEYWHYSTGIFYLASPSKHLSDIDSTCLSRILGVILCPYPQGIQRSLLFSYWQRIMD
jgi:hypothetical protein